MKLVTIADERGGRPGLIHGDQIFDLRVGHPALSLSGWRPNSVITVMDAGEAGLDHLQRLTEALAAADDSELEVCCAPKGHCCRWPERVWPHRYGVRV